MKFTISMRMIHNWFDGAIGPVVEIAQRVEEAGLHQVSVVDHILMSEDLSGYPYGKFEAPLEAHWWEPVTVLAAMAGQTSRVRLSTAVIVSPIRPAAFLAKQLTTLDHLSNGRLDAGLGVGWHKAEYDSTGVPWENRFTQMEEQISACRALWTQAPASFHGKYVDFDRVYQKPFPVQKGGIPIWLGVSGTDRSLARVADFADGWHPPFNSVDELAPALEKLRRLFKDRGRDPKSLTTRVVMPYVKNDKGPDLDGSLKLVPQYEKLGVTMMEITPAMYCRGVGELDGFLKAVKSAQ
jgi:probable F420-dependent oxidoreductase